MDGTAHYAEHSVQKKYEGSYGRKRNFTIAMFIIVPIVVLFAMLAVIGAGAFIWFVPLSPTAILICKRGIYDRYFGIEYVYKISGGNLYLSRHNDGRYARDILSFQICKAEFILPYRDEYKTTVEAADHDIRIEAVSSMKGEDVYAILFEDENRRKTLLFIDGLSKSVKLFSLYNKNTVVVPTRY